MQRTVGILLLASAVVMPASVTAQSLGTFRWQLEPHCNVLTLTVTQVGDVYRLEGTDDQCGAGRDRASAAGLAFPNPDGSIGFGLTIVTAPGAAPIHLDAEIALATLSGTWRRNGGGSGAFRFTNGTVTAGPPMPAPSSVVPSSISLLPGGGIVARAEGDSGIPATGGGTRMMWYPAKAAFRAGAVAGPHWDDPNVGLHSAALGFNTVASGHTATAVGRNTIASGADSTASGADTQAVGPRTLAGGAGTSALGAQSVALGEATVAAGRNSTALGERTTASGNHSLTLGYQTTTLGFASIAGGRGSAANGDVSVALGTRAVTTAAAQGSFVFADASSDNPFTSFAPNEFVVRAAGGVGVYTNAATTTGAEMAPGGGSWAALSDANMKENFREVPGEDVLAKLAAMPVREWNYTSQDSSIRHMGPTAQDFRAAFGLGDFPLRINTTDADGVALAAIKALEARTRALPDALEALARLQDAYVETQSELSSATAALAGATAEIQVLRERLNAFEEQRHRR